MQYSQEQLKTMVYAKFGGQTECIMGNWKIENTDTFWIILRFWETASLPLPKANINTYFALGAKCWL